MVRNKAERVENLEVLLCPWGGSGRLLNTLLLDPVFIFAAQVAKGIH
jgi:hypothetical protein